MKSWLSELFKKYFVVYFPWVVVFTASLYPPADSDLGWHLKYGEYFFNHFQILKENTFSQLMPTYLWVNSSWLVDLITYSIFQTMGFVGLTLLGAAVIATALYLFFSLTPTSFWTKALLLPLILYLERPLFEVSFRGQLLSLLLIGVLYKILSLFEKGHTNILFALIPLFMLWSNLHGQFLFGLILATIWLFISMGKRIYIKIKSKKGNIIKQLLVISLTLCASYIAPIIHPYGFGVYEEAIKHFGHPLQQFIVEWIPFDMFSQLWWKLVLWTILLVVSSLFIVYKKKTLEHIHYIAIALLLCYLSFWVRRYTWPMILTSIPVVYFLFEAVKPKWKDIRDTIAIVFIILVYLYVVMWKAPKENMLTMNWQRYCSNYVGCSAEAVEYIIENNLDDKLLTFYNWGGYIIWKYPVLKPTIDGRMHLWQDEIGFSAFRHYYPIEQNWIDVDTTSYNTVLITPRKPLYRRLLELVKEGKWEIAYKDNLAGVFVRKKIN